MDRYRPAQVAQAALEGRGVPEHLDGPVGRTVEERPENDPVRSLLRVDLLTPRVLAHVGEEHAAAGARHRSTKFQNSSNRVGDTCDSQFEKKTTS
jgi:hypothetical protein